MPNPLNHLELPVTDLVKAKEFYDKIFDWSIDLEMMPNYGIANIKPVSIGFFKVEKIPKRGVNVVIEVADIDSKMKEVVAAGGKEVRAKYEIAPNIGHAADFQDVFGNYLSLFSPPKN